MRLPLILADEPITPSTGGFPRMPSGSAAFTGLEAAGRGLERIGQHLTTQFAEAENQRRRLDDTIQRGVVLAQLGETVTGDLQTLHEQGLSPEAYQAEGIRVIDERIRAAHQTIRDPEGQRHFQLEAAQFGARARAAVNTQAYQGKLARMGIESVGTLTRLANEAVWGVTPEAQRDAYARLQALPEAMARTGVWSADEAKSQRASALAQVERGSIDRDARNPNLVGDVINLLSRGAYVNLPSHEQSTILDGLLSKGNAARVAADQKRKDQQEESERGLAVRIRDAATPEALAAAEDEVRGLMAPGERGLTSEKGEHFFNLIDAKRNPAAVDDEPTVRALQIPVYALKTSEGAVASMEARTNLALETRKLTPATHRIYMNELQQQRDRLKAAATKADPLDKILQREHADVEKSITRLIRTKGALSADFDAQTQAVLDDAMREHDRVSKANGGTEASNDWWDRRRSHYIARVTGITANYGSGVASGIPVAYRPVGLSPENPVASKQAIEQARIKLRDAPALSPADRLDAGRRLLELSRLYNELERLKYDATAAAEAAKNKTVPVSPSPSGQVTGRPR